MLKFTRLASLSKVGALHAQVTTDKSHLQLYRYFTNSGDTCAIISVEIQRNFRPLLVKVIQMADRLIVEIESHRYMLRYAAASELLPGSG